MEEIYVIELDIRYFRRWMLLDTNKKAYYKGHEWNCAELVNALEADRNTFKSKMELIEDMIKEEIIKEEIIKESYGGRKPDTTPKSAA